MRFKGGQSLREKAWPQRYHMIPWRLMVAVSNDFEAYVREVFMGGMIFIFN